MLTLVQEIRFALRLLARSPGFAIVVILTLALGMGVNSAIFSVVNAVLLRPLPFAQPERLAVIWESRIAQGNFMFAAPPTFHDWRTQSRSFSNMGAFSPQEFVIMGSESQRVMGALVSHDLLPTLGVQPALGRGFTPAEERASGERVVLISDALWRSRFANSPGVLGQTLALNNGRFTIVGVLPPSFVFPPAIDLEGHTVPRRTDIWVPFRTDFAGGNRGAHFMTVIGRLAPSATLASAETEMRTLASVMGRLYPETNRAWTVRLVPFERVLVGNVRSALWVLLGAVGLVLLIACVNVANLMLTRSAARQREYAIRAALGAARVRLIRQTIIESQLLAVFGGLAGLLLAWGAIRLLARFAPPELPPVDGSWIDARVVLYTMGLATLTGLLFGLAPALRAFSTDIGRLMQQGARAGFDRRHTRLRSTLTVAQIALSLVLLVAAGLLFRSFVTMRSVDTGIITQNVVTMRVLAPATLYPEPHRTAGLFRELETRLRATPGVEAVGFTRDIPLAADFQGTRITAPGFVTDQEADNARTHFTAVTPGYFAGMSIPLVNGRNFDERDATGGAPVVIVNQALARGVFGNTSAVGQQIQFQGQPTTIIGVVGDVRLEKITDEPRPIVYQPHAQAASYRSLSLVLRGHADAAALALAAQRIVREVDPAVATFDVKPMWQVLSDSVAQPRFSAFVLLVFSALALALAAVGIYGVISYSVTQRTREIGVRIAVGARPRDALALVLREALLLAAVGVGLGVIGAIASARLFSALLYGVLAVHVPTLVSTAAFMIIVAFAASLLPALRASRLQPLEAMGI
ncbi:MAG: ABC transporter permease [Longimicrobiales bacterium]